MLEKNAKRLGISQSFFFQTVSHQYRLQLKMLKDLEEKAASGDAKSRTEYNRVSSAANQTALTLIKILNSDEKTGEKTGCNLIDYDKKKTNAKKGKNK